MLTKLNDNKDTKLKGKAVIITGASANVGKELCLQIAEKYKGQSITFILLARTYNNCDLKYKLKQQKDQEPVLKKLKNKLANYFFAENNISQEVLPTSLTELKDKIQSINKYADVRIGKVDLRDKNQVNGFFQSLFEDKSFPEIAAFVHCAWGSRGKDTNNLKKAQKYMQEMVSLNLTGFDNIMSAIIDNMNEGIVIAFGSVAQGGSLENPQYALVKARMLERLKKYRRISSSKNIAFTGIIQGLMRRNNAKQHFKSPGIPLNVGVQYVTSLLELPARMEVKYTSPVGTTTSLKRFSPYKNIKPSYNPQDPCYMESKRIEEMNVAVANPFSPIGKAIINAFNNKGVGNLILVYETNDEKKKLNENFKTKLNVDVSIVYTKGLKKLANDIDLLVINAYAKNEEKFIDEIKMCGFNKMKDQETGGRILVIGTGDYVNAYTSSLNAKMFFEKKHKFSFGGIQIADNVIEDEKNLPQGGILAKDIAAFIANTADFPPEFSIENTKLQASKKLYKLGMVA